VVQRRQLAQQGRQPPRLQPRCQVPDWFHDLRAAAATGYREARDALNDSMTTRKRLVATLEVASHRIADANTRCAPFDTELNGAYEAVRQAEAAQRAAQHRLDQSGLRGRRQARTELATADEAVAGTRDLLVVAREKSCEPYAQRNIARFQIDAARNALSNHDVLAEWNYLPRHLSTAEAHLEAFDTWHDWATGKPVDHQRLTDAVNAFHEMAVHELAEAIHLWAEPRGIQVTRPQPQHRRSVGIEIDL